MYDTPFQNEELSGYKFLVTGGAGFIGSNLVEYLLKNNAQKVVVLDNLSTGFEDNLKNFISDKRFQFIKGDICQLDDCTKACNGIDFVFHQAALGSVPRSIANPIGSHNANASGFLSMLVAAKNAGVKRLVYASSSSVYGDSQKSPKREGDEGRPLSPYAVTKIINEYYADIFYRTYGMEVIGLRYFNIFGPRQNPKGEYAAAIPLFINGLLNDQAVFINGDGNQSRDFTFVENAVQGNVKAMFCKNQSAIGRVFNIAVGEQISINSLYGILQKYIGSEMAPKYRGERQGDVKNSLADISAARDLFGYEPKVRVEDGLKMTVDWFRAYFNK